MEKLYPKLIQHLVRSCDLTVRPPTFGNLEIKPANSVRGMTVRPSTPERVFLKPNGIEGYLSGRAL